jgi:hypothetical protein
VSYPQHACPHRLYYGQERVARKHEDRVGVVEDVGNLVRSQPVVHRHGDGAYRAHGRACEQHVGRVWRVYDSMVARLEPEADESVGEPIPSLEEGVPAQDRVTVNDGRMVGLTRGVGGEEIHGHHCTIRLHRPVGVVAACGS